MIPSNIDKNLTLLDNGSNGDSVPATVPGSELAQLTRQRLNTGHLPIGIARSPQCNPAFRGSAPTVREEWLPARARPYHGCALPTELGGRVLFLQLDTDIAAAILIKRPAIRHS